MIKKKLVGGQNKNEKIFFNFIFFFSFNLKAAIIFDYEIEHFINDLLKEISLINEYKKEIPFSIVLDDNPNAFINSKNRLFISTGLLKYTESYEAIVGVLAHEIGHLHRHHIAKRKKSIKNVNTINKLTNLSIIAGSLISNNNEYLVQSIVTNQYGIQNYFQSFSRDQEREADNYAIKTLEKLRVSNKPLINFLNYLENLSIKKGIPLEYRKFSTHPIYKERYNIINNNAKNDEYYFDYNMNQKFKFIQAKLFGFTEKNKINDSKYLKNDFKIYTNSIILGKNGMLKESIKDLNYLLKKQNNYYYILETKADILYSNGFLNEAKLFFEKVLYKNPKNIYVKKRIFDIKFSLNEIKNKNIAKNIFYDYNSLLIIFENNLILKEKFKILAKNANLKRWLEFFLLEKEYLDNHIDKEEFINKINNIKDSVAEKNLINFIEKIQKEKYETI